MGFFKQLFGLEDKKSNNLTTTTFVTDSEEQSFENSIYGALQIYDAEVRYISDVLPEEGYSLQKQISLLTQLLEKTNNENDIDVQNAFNELKRQFEEYKRLADGEYTLNELEHQNKMMDSVFEKPLSNGGISKEKLDQFIDYITKIQEKVNNSEKEGSPLLSNIQRQKFNKLSMKSEYRIKMLELMYLLNYGEVETNPFKDLSLVKQKMFSKFFFDDAEIAAKQYDYLSNYESLFNEYRSDYFPLIDSIAQKLNAQMADAKMIDDFSIRQLFDSNNQNSDSFKFLKDFIKFKTKMNEMENIRQNLVDQKNEILQKEAKENEENLKLKEYTNEEIEKEIYRIEHDLSAKGSRFVNILDFQKKVAIAKGLLDSEPLTQNPDLVYKSVSATNAWQIIDQANKSGVNYIVFPNCQENANNLFMIAVSKTDKDILKLHDGENPFSTHVYNWSKDIEYGKFPLFILEQLHEKIDSENISDYIYATDSDSSLYTLYLGYNIYNGKPPKYKKMKDTIYEKLQEIKSNMKYLGTSEKDFKDVLCFISIPATQNIIPILENFKSSGITPYLEPVPYDKNRNSEDRNNIHIYFERKDLAKYTANIAPNISSKITGLFWDTPQMGVAIRDEITWPTLVEKEKE